MISQLQKVRLSYEPKLPSVLRGEIAHIACSQGSPTNSLSHTQEIGQLFKNTYGMPIVRFDQGLGKCVRAMKTGVVLSGGQAPGGHNILCGLYDALQKMSKNSQLIGFLGGPSGIIENRFIEITEELIGSYRNTGGFDMIGSGRTKLEGEEVMRKALSVANSHQLDALFIVGGDDSNTNAAVLAEYFKSQGALTVVVGVPKTIDGDLKNEHIEVSFGFDTACKTYSELIGNIARDAMSAQKYWHFIKLMGRSASHIALECALQTQVNFTLISEEIEKESKTLENVVESIVKVVVERYRKGYAFGLVLIPEGLIEFIPEIKNLITEINDLLALNQENFDALGGFAKKIDWLKEKLSSVSKASFESLPTDIQAQLVMDRDPHGNVQVSHIETEKLLILMVEERLKVQYPEVKFNAMGHFFGYEGRCAFPSNFDANYCYALGYNAVLLAHFGLSGYMSNIAKLHLPSENWVAGGIPLTMMMNLEQRHGQLKPVIKKALVDLEGKAFKYFAKQRNSWAVSNSFVYPGAIQYYGPSSVCDVPTKTLLLESE